MKRHKLFLCSDPHFFHKKIVEGWSEGEEQNHSGDGSRPYQSVQEHNDALVSNWNSVVGENDTTWVLGDILFNDYDADIFGDLNGTLKLVPGNHDTPAKLKAVEKYFSRVESYPVIGKSIILSHIPIHPMDLDIGRYKYNIHGHTHGDKVMIKDESTGKMVKDKRYICVSMEQINYTPISFDEIKETYMNNV